MYIYAANVLATQGEWRDENGFLEYCHYRLLNNGNHDFVVIF